MEIEFVLNKKYLKPVKCWRIATTLEKCSVYIGNSSARLGNLSGKYIIFVLFINLHTYTAGSKSTGAGSWFDSSPFVAVFVGETRSIVARQRLARVVFERDDCEERQNWTKKILSQVKLMFCIFNERLYNFWKIWLVTRMTISWHDTRSVLCYGKHLTSLTLLVMNI